MSLVPVTLLMVLTVWCPLLTTCQSTLSSISDCLGKDWKKVLRGQDVPCSGAELCYNNGMFAVCFNKYECIPQFTAHILDRGNTRSCSGSSNNWRNDANLQLDPRGRRCLHQHYKMNQQKVDFRRYYAISNKGGKYFAKGHLTPCADFSTKSERDLAFLNTNAAPQWQAFNGGNWKKIETALRNYANKERSEPSKRRKLFIFTGTGRRLVWRRDRELIKLNGTIQAPAFFWKVVCDPVARESVAIIGNQAFRHAGRKRTHRWPGFGRCEMKGDSDIRLLSVDDAKAGNWGIPSDLPLGSENCQPHTPGTTLTEEIGDEFCLKRPVRQPPAKKRRIGG